MSKPPSSVSSKRYRTAITGRFIGDKGRRATVKRARPQSRIVIRKTRAS